jgi:tetratricopeptide (TPR) repeat protein
MGLFILCSVACLAVAAFNRGRAETYYQQAVGLHTENDSQGALDYYNKTLAANPFHVGALTNRCGILSQFGRLEKALADCSLAITLDATKARAYANRCVVYFSLGDFGSAQRDCEKAVSLDPADYYVYTCLGLFYHLQEDYDLAVESFSKSLQLDPTAATYSYRGSAYREMAEYDLALNDFLSAYELAPQDIQNSITFPYLYVVMGDYDSALREANTLVERFPDAALSYYISGQTNEAIGNKSQAIEDYRRAIDIDLNYAVAYRSLGDLAYNDAIWDEALAYYCSYLQHDETPSQVVVMRIDQLGGCP